MAATDTRSVALRPLAASDQVALWDWLHLALWDPPPAPLRPRAVLDLPHIRIYAEDWGRSDDVGVVAVVAGIDAGACWMRLLPEGVGLASIDAHTPQLAISLLAQFRHQGIGESLLRGALAAARLRGFRQVSLTVHPQNTAIHLYRRCGFRDLGLRGSYRLMLAPTQSPHGQGDE